MHSPPEPAPSAAPADWLTGRIGVTERSWVINTVGVGFAAYARIFHPLGDEPDALRWQDVATRNGRTMHVSAEWEHISCPPGRQIPDHPVGRGYPGGPAWGDLRPVFLQPLCDLLAAHTTTPDRSWFAMWEGGGWLGGPGPTLSATRDGSPPPRIEHAPRRWQLDLRAPRFRLPYGREYLLYQGAVHDALRFGSWVTKEWFLPHSPHLFWPDDHAWCVATEIDFDTTLVGGSRPLIDAIAGSPALEAFAISADAPARDEVNI